MDTNAFFKLSYGLYIVTSKKDDKESGCVINTMTQITAQPAQVAITINKENYTTSLIQDSRVFNVSVLLDNVSMDVIKTFEFQSGRNTNKFKDGNYGEDKNGLKYLKDASATFSCQVKKSVDVGSHIMFIAEVTEAQILNDGEVLTYAAYHEKKKVKQGWLCDVCGFIYEGEQLPEDYICPVCKVDASHFSKI